MTHEDWISFAVARGGFWLIYISVIAVLSVAVQMWQEIPAKRKPQPEKLVPVYKPKRLDGFVYLIRSHDGLYKIGRTNNLANRLHEYRVHWSSEVHFDHTITCQDSYKAERILHQRYADKRVRGEWFALTADDVETIKSIKEM